MAVPIPPSPVPAAPAPPVAPVIPSAPRVKKSFPGKIIFAVLGLLVVLAVGVATGLLSRVVPGLGSSTLTYWGLWESEAVIRPILDEFEKTHPGTKVNYQFQSHVEYSERLKSALSQGKGPDVFRIHNTWTPEFRQYLSPVPSSVYSVADYEKTFYPVTKTDFRIGGTYYAVPLEVDGIAMFVNNDLLSKAGLPVPENWDQLRDAAVAMSVCASSNSTCASGGKIIISGVALGSTQNVDHWQDILAALLLQNNVNLSNPSQLSSTAAEDVFNYFTSFTSLHRLWDPNLPTSTSSFAAGKVGIYFGPSWRVFDIQNLNPNLKFSVHPLPQLPVDLARGEQPVAYASYWAEAVNNKSSNQSKAWELIQYLSSPDVLRQLYQRVQSPQRAFGEPYSRQDMSADLKDSPYVATFISQAPLLKSWYLASYTHTGPDSLNTKLSDLFAQVISHEKNVSSLATEVNTLLSSYGLSSVQSP
jgi:multiple sugar transport system substrate-binding protein